MKTNPDLWRKLERLEFDTGPVPFGFARRLARDNGWSQDYAEQVLQEYKRFVYLAMTAGHEVTPSDEVDQAWHLHLTYTRHYWGPFTDLLGAPLHHGPTTGTTADKHRFDDQYAATKELYEQEFGCAPPSGIWPPAAIRFGDAPYFQRINTRTHLVVPVPGWLGRLFRSRLFRGAGILTAIGIPALPVAGAAMQSEPGDGDINLLIAFAALAGIAIIVGIVVKIVRQGSSNSKADGGGAGYADGSSKTADSGSDGGGSGCGDSGCGGCGG